MFRELEITTRRRCEFIDMTAEIQKFIEMSNISDGVCYVYTPHTTAALTINENADPSVIGDMKNFLDEAIPVAKKYFNHTEGNSDAHIKSSLIGNSLFVFVRNGRLELGTWQGIYFCEFDGPRRRQIWLKIINDKETS